jgi:heme exporter protein B
LIGCVYLCYLAVQKINSAPVWKMKEKLEWNALLWILLFFNAIITVSRSFFSETKGRSLYNFSIYDPTDFIASKLIYNMILVLAVSLLGYFFFAVFVGNPVNNQLLFLVNLIFSAVAFSGILTLTSGIASKTTGGFTLMSILSIPLLFPMLLLAMRISLMATIGSDFSECLNYLLGLLILNIIISSLCLMLFPYLWRE